MADIEKKIENVLALSNKEKYDYFVRKVVDFKEIWGLYNDGWALLGAKSEHTVFPFWPEEIFAAKCAVGLWEGYKPRLIQLKDFLEKWISGMIKDGIMINLFFVEGDTNPIIDPVQLKKDIYEELKQYEYKGISLKEIEKVTSLQPFERYRYFIKKVADSEKLYLLEHDNGDYVTSELDGNILFPLWSAIEFAELCRINGWEKCNVKEITLENFEDEIIDIIAEFSYLINVFPLFEKTGFVVGLDEFALDLNDELKNYS